MSFSSGFITLYYFLNYSSSGERTLVRMKLIRNRSGDYLKKMSMFYDRKITSNKFIFMNLSTRFCNMVFYNQMIKLIWNFRMYWKCFFFSITIFIHTPFYVFFSYVSSISNYIILVFFWFIGIIFSYLGKLIIFTKFTEFNLSSQFLFFLTRVFFHENLKVPRYFLFILFDQNSMSPIMFLDYVAF